MIPSALIAVAHRIYLTALATSIWALLPLSAGAQNNGGLAVSTPASWRTEATGQGFYSVKKIGDDPGELMIMVAFLPADKHAVRAYVEAAAKHFVQSVRGSEWTHLQTEEYTLLEIAGEEFSGFYVQFKISDDLLQAMFAISSAHGSWSGQYTGDGKNWNAALDIIKKLRSSPRS